MYKIPPLLQEHLFNVPGWSYLDHGDEVLCVNEIKLGLLGKSCLCPGFSTMMANLIRMSSHQHDHFDVSILCLDCFFSVAISCTFIIFIFMIFFTLISLG